MIAGEQQATRAATRQEPMRRIGPGHPAGYSPGDGRASIRAIEALKRSNLSDRARAIFFSIPAISNLIDKAGFSSASPNVSGTRLGLGVAAGIWVE